MVNSDLLAKLNAQQAEAVTLQWGPALVIAGAGSGKTTVLTRRIAFLMAQLHQDAESILAVTFTNKAAAEMKRRVEDLVGFEMTRRLTIGTFHSVCARILRREIDEYQSQEGWQWNKNFVIYDESDSLSLVKAAIKRMDLDQKVFVPKSIRHEISSIKNDAITSAQYASDAKSYKEQRLSEIFSAYQSELARNNALDFDDLISIFTDMLKTRPEVLARQRERFRHILVDEYQDTNKLQYELVSLLAGPGKDVALDPGAQASRLHNGSEIVATEGWHERTLMVVGDVDQSIYSWRKADFRIILGFQKDYKTAKLIKLEENYRSTSTILEIANSIIVNNKERLEKVLRCNRGKGSKSQCYEAADEIDEAHYVVEELKRLKARGKTLSEAVILYRTNAQSRAIEEVLVRSHMPYTMVGGTRFYERQEIKDIIAYLKLIYNGKDGQAFNRVINVPRRGIGKTTLDKVADFAQTERVSMLEAASRAVQVRELSPKVARQLMDFANLVVRWQNMASICSVSGLLELVLRDIQYIEKLQEDADSSKDELALGRIENVREFINVAKDFEATADEPDLDSFLTRISLVSDLDAVKENQDTIKLMTLHSAKGLEFSVVFLMGLEEGLFPHMRSLESESAMEEERRLMYVGVTRAADLLYLTRARKRMLMNRGEGGSFGTNYTVASRFLKEIKAGLLQGYYPSPDADAEFTERGEGYGKSNGSGGSGYTRTGYSDESDHYDDNESNVRDIRSGRSQGNGSQGNYNRSQGGQDSGAGYNRTQGSQGAQGNGSTFNRPGGQNNAAGFNRQGIQGNGSPYNRPANQSNGSSFNRQGQPGQGQGQPGQANSERPRAMRPGTTSGDSRFVSNSSRDLEANRPPSAADNSFEKLSVGDSVMHTKFGTGKVVKVIGDNDKQIYDVQFEGDAGKRLLDPKFAKLIKLS